MKTESLERLTLGLRNKELKIAEFEWMTLGPRSKVLIAEVEWMTLGLRSKPMKTALLYSC